MALSSPISGNESYVIDNSAVVIDENDVYVVSIDGKVTKTSRSDLKLTKDADITIVKNALQISSGNSQVQYKLHDYHLVKENEVTQNVTRHF